jgi:transcriptional regulator with XRE-family HTH domain
METVGQPTATKKRRLNDALKYSKADTPFAREVKRFAKAYGLSGREFAVGLGYRDQGALTRALEAKASRGSRGTRRSTAEEFADVLNVPRRYLRILATQSLDNDADDSDEEYAARALTAAIDSAIYYLRDGARDEIQAAWFAFLKRNRDAACAVMIDAYLRSLRRIANTNCGIFEPERDPAVQLFEILAPLEFNWAELLVPIKPSTLRDVYLLLRNHLPQDDVTGVVDSWRLTLKGRGAYGQVMDELLAAAAESTHR